MFQLSLFIECETDKGIFEIVEEINLKLINVVTSSEVVERKPYWKMDGWFKIICNFNTKISLDYPAAEEMLKLISDKWVWNKGKVCAHSSAKELAATFCNPSIKFSTCWFEDFE